MNVVLNAVNAKGSFGGFTNNLHPVVTGSSTQEFAMGDKWFEPARAASAS